MPETNYSSTIFIIFASFGIVIYIFLSSSFSFKDKLFNTIFPTRFSQAQESLSIYIKNPTDGVILPGGSSIFIDTQTPVSLVSRVEFYVNNELICIVKSKPLNCIWKIPEMVGNRYKIVTKIYDNLGRSAFDTVTITAR